MLVSLALGILLNMAGCRPSPAPPIVPGEAERVAAPGPEVEAVRLDPAEAARLAREIQAETSTQVAPGLQLTLFAPDQLLEDPMALDVDAQGRLYVTSSSRPWLLDIRRHRSWMVEAHAVRSVEDLRGFYRRVLSPERSAQHEWLTDLNADGSHDWRDLAVPEERLYRILDTDRDGVADFSQVMIEGFNGEVNDFAGGVLAHDGEIFLAAAPDLWKLRDTDGDGVIDSRESISHGYNVHPGFPGHGMSGVTLGPDGRIYWTVGDLGLNVVDREGRRWEYPNQGAILRANRDGSDFEVFATGLRNLQEFAFDEHGNLVSVDNDGDYQGETERVVYVVQGSDSGWRTNWQFGKNVDPDNNAYNVWMDEALYRPRFEGQAAYITPPLAAYHSGPAGMVYNPGTALSERWRNHFFVAEFVGAPARSRIHAFQLAEQGAGFELARDTVLLSGVLTVGLRFGPDGALYLADWVTGWEPKGQGRIWKLDAPAEASTPQRAETRALLAESFQRRSASDLRGLLAHPDQRVRLKAQFELADRSDARTLLRAARAPGSRLARLHAIWGMGQVARGNPGEAAPLVSLLGDADAEVRAQAAKVLGDVRYAPAADALVARLRDDAPRVRFFAAEALGRIRHRPAVQPLVAMLEANEDRDVYLRHAGALALARIGDPGPVAALADHPSRAVRLAAVVALRRMRDAGVARFLSDRDERVVTEAARAINDDGGIEAAVPALARLLEDERFSSEALLRRAIGANLRLGTPEAAQRVAAYASRTGAPDELRAEAVASLGVWPTPSTLDRVDGSHLGAVQRNPSIARAALAGILAPLLADGSAPVQVALADAAGRLELREAAPTLAARVRSGSAPEVRIAALRALQALGDPRTEAAVRQALQDPEETVRMAALGTIPGLELPETTTAELLASVVGRGSVAEQQTAVAALGKLRGNTARETLTRLVNELAGGRLAPEIHLDVVEAARATGHAALLARLAALEAGRAASDPVAAWADALHGGSAPRGRRIVLQNEAAQCVRCHTLGEPGPEVGPNLAGIGSRLTREQLLEALVAPSARIAPGFGAPGSPSAMPPMGQLLSRRDLRDVVEFLTTLR